jgi:hypothetical protein
MTAQVDISPDVAADAIYRALCRRLIARIAEADAPTCAEPIDLELKLHCIILERNKLRSSLTASEKLVADLKAEHREEIKQMQREFREELRDAVAEARSDERESTRYGN